MAGGSPYDWKDVGANFSDANQAMAGASQSLSNAGDIWGKLADRTQKALEHRAMMLQRQAEQEESSRQFGLTHGLAERTQDWKQEEDLYKREWDKERARVTDRQWQLEHALKDAEGDREQAKFLLEDRERKVLSETLQELHSPDTELANSMRKDAEALSNTITAGSMNPDRQQELYARVKDLNEEAEYVASTPRQYTTDSEESRELLRLLSDKGFGYLSGDDRVIKNVVITRAKEERERAAEIQKAELQAAVKSAEATAKQYGTDTKARLKASEDAFVALLASDKMPRKQGEHLQKARNDLMAMGYSQTIANETVLEFSRDNSLGYVPTWSKNTHVDDFINATDNASKNDTYLGKVAAALAKVDPDGDDSQKTLLPPREKGNAPTVTPQSVSSVSEAETVLNQIAKDIKAERAKVDSPVSESERNKAIDKLEQQALGRHMGFSNISMPVNVSKSDAEAYIRKERAKRLKELEKQERQMQIRANMLKSRNN